ncbi:MAG: mucoidy inhibitor MuiA family protein [Bacteroidetes bacterium]|nr:mucoidy inhibitor MuiA family protein [Bacteroidota bacterium]
MRKIILIFTGLFLLIFSGYSQEQTLSASISEVTVFLQGAQVTMRSESPIQAGRNVLKISRLSPQIDPNSLQVKGDGAFTIQSVNFQVNYLDSLEESKERENLSKKLEDIRKKTEDVNKRFEILKAKENFLNNNQVVSGKDQAVNAEQYRLHWEMFSRNIEQVKLDILDQQRKLKDLSEEMEKIQNQLNDKMRKTSKATGEVIITVTAKNPGNARFQLSYLVNDAGWYPSYDIRVDKLDEPLNLVYKANVYQRSGVEWKNVHLTLSNARPFQSGILPVLNPYYLYPPVVTIYEITDYKRPLTSKDQSAQPGQMQVGGVQSSDFKPFNESSQPLQVNINENQTNIEFEVDAIYTIAPDGKPQSMEIQRLQLPAEYLYRGLPKLDKEGFLTARVKDWEQYNLIEGEVNLYFENTYVGKSRLNLSAISDTLTLSLGRDKGVVLSRTRVKNFTQKQFLGGNRIETRQWELGIKNNKNQKIHINLADQIPVSNSSDIQVEVEDLSGGRLTKETGLVNWELDLLPKEAKKLVIKYVVKYPKSMKLVVD